MCGDVNDRNVCIRIIPASAIALPQNYPSWMENNWMYFYGAPWSYGCIKSGEDGLEGCEQCGFIRLGTFFILSGTCAHVL